MGKVQRTKIYDIQQVCYFNIFILQSYSNRQANKQQLFQLFHGRRLVILVRFALRTPKDTLLFPAELDIFALAHTTAAIARHYTVGTLGGALPRRRLLDFTDHLAEFPGTAFFHGEAYFATALRMSCTATSSRLALLLLSHTGSRVT